MEAADSLGDLRGVGNGVSSHSQPVESSLTVSTSVTDSMRSSNSSLAKSESSDTTTPSSVLRHPGRATSAHLKKVSICDVVSSPVGKREGQAVSPSGGERGLSHRASLPRHPQTYSVAKLDPEAEDGNAQVELSFSVSADPVDPEPAAAEA